jgi:uncharacterized membrane protein YkvA (DUF1232 family)
MTALDRWNQRARDVRNDVYALYLSCRDRRVPWYAKVAAGCVVAYAASPFDLIPDFIPVLGYLDDLLILPAGVLLVRRMIPRAVLAEHRHTATARFATTPLFTWAGAAIVVASWAAIIALIWLAVR